MPYAIRIVDRLQDQADVSISSPADGQVLTYQSGHWANAAAPAGGGAGGGNTTYTNAYASPPVSPSNGDQWWPSDGVGLIFLRSGGAWVPYYRSEPAVTPPAAAAGWSWYNQNSSTLVDTKGALLLTSGGSAGTNSSLIYRGLTSTTPYTLTVRMVPVPPLASNTDWGLAVRESSSGKYQTITWQNGAMNLFDWTSNTSVTGDGSATTTSQLGPPDWWQIQDDGTNRVFRVGWHTKGALRTFFTKGRTNFCTPDQWGIYLDNQGAASPYAALLIVSAQEA